MNLKNLFLTAALSTLGLTAADAARITARVPFPFEAKGVAMPAGTYEIARSDRGGSLTVRNRTTGKAVYSVVRPAGRTRAEGSWMAFQKYGDRYFLTEVKSAGDSTAVALPGTKLNNEMALTATPETVVVRAD